MKQTNQTLFRGQNRLGFGAIFLLAVTISKVALAQLAVPASLVPGGFVFPPPVGVNPTGTLLASATTPFLSASLNGTLISRVYSGDTTSPLSGLTFTYQIVLSATSPDSVSQLSLSHFGSFLTDVSFVGSQPANDPPSFISRSHETGSVGDVLQFHFGPPGDPGQGFLSLMPGNTSALLIVQTSAPQFQGTTASIIDGVAVPNIASFAPLVPEPSAAVLGLAGIACLALRRRKK